MLSMMAPCGGAGAQAPDLLLPPSPPVAGMLEAAPMLRSVPALLAVEGQTPLDEEVLLRVARAGREDAV